MLHAGALFRMAVHGLKEIIQKFEVSLRLLACYTLLNNHFTVVLTFHILKYLSSAGSTEARLE